MPTKISFASDNYAGAHSKVIDAITRASSGSAKAYGDDPITKKVIKKFKQNFSSDTEVFFVFNGTAANVLGLKSVTQSYEAVICSEWAHIQNDECGAPESILGCKIVTLKTPDGKLTPKLIDPILKTKGDQHKVQARVISISQTTEVGTLYTPKEIKALADFAHKNGLYLHMDGARISNAAAALNCTLKGLTLECGVDILSFGGTKNGLLYGEAVIFFNPGLAKSFKYIRKQCMQLASKMRFISVQFDAFLSDQLWFKNAKHANDMTALLVHKLAPFFEIEILYTVQANAIFAKVPARVIDELKTDFDFYIWDDTDSKRPVVRWMTSFETTQSEIIKFSRKIQEIFSKIRVL